MVELNPDKTFAARPAIGERFRCATTGEILTVAATWPRGVVFEGEQICTAFDLLKDYDPECHACGAFHEPEYPHDYSATFRMHILWKHGRKATQEDTFAHCNGLMRAAIASAHA